MTASVESRCRAVGDRAGGPPCTAQHAKPRVTLYLRYAAQARRASPRGIAATARVALPPRYEIGDRRRRKGDPIAATPVAELVRWSRVTAAHIVAPLMCLLRASRRPQSDPRCACLTRHWARAGPVRSARSPADVCRRVAGLPRAARGDRLGAARARPALLRSEAARLSGDDIAGVEVAARSRTCRDRRGRERRAGFGDMRVRAAPRACGNRAGCRRHCGAGAKR